MVEGRFSPRTRAAPPRRMSPSRNAAKWNSRGREPPEIEKKFPLGRAIGVASEHAQPRLEQFRSAANPARPSTLDPRLSTLPTPHQSIRNRQVLDVIDESGCHWLPVLSLPKGASVLFGPKARAPRLRNSAFQGRVRPYPPSQQNDATIGCYAYRSIPHVMSAKGLECHSLIQTRFSRCDAATSSLLFR